MSFEFSKSDSLELLHEDIKTYLPTFMINRYKEFDLLKIAIKSHDIDEVRAYCHKQKGVAGSYKCFKLEEITSYMYNLALKGEMDAVEQLMPMLKVYLDELANQIESNLI